MRRLLGVGLLVLLVAAGCSDPQEDARNLRRRLNVSSNEPRVFTYRAVAEDQAFVVRGRAEDDLRYSMTLRSGRRDLVDYVIHDDALAVRLRDVEFGGRLANVLGDPVVDAALKEGRWVMDPGGAPPLLRTEIGTGAEPSGDPFRDARESLEFTLRAMQGARAVQRFSLENIEYRSAIDPWRYPNEERGEERFDLLRPFLPTSEATATAGGAAGDIGPAQFRKTSVFTDNNRVVQVCSLIDIEGHEEFLALRERGLNSNPFLRNLLERLRNKETPVPVDEQYFVGELRYPRRVSVQAPADAVVGKLEVFLSALQQAIAGGVLRARNADTSECRRRGDPEEG